MPKVLMVAYHFPPITSGGVRRSVKFARYLPEFGWEPVVLSVDGRSGLYPTDPTTLVHVPPGCRVVRTRSVEATVMRWAKKLHLTRLIKFFFVPDLSVLWVPSAVRAGLRLVREEGIDVIYTSSMPISIHLTGLILHKLTGKPWVADWRDIWIQNEGTLARAPTSLHRSLYRWLERTFVRQAAMTIGHSVGHRDVLRREYPEVTRERIVAIPMGYDPEDFAGPPPPPFPRFTVLFAGTFYGAPSVRRPPEGLGPRLRYWIGEHVLDRHTRQIRRLLEQASPLYFLHAVRGLLDEHPELTSDFRVVFLGKLTPDNQTLLDELGLGQVVSFIGWVPYEETLRQMRKAHVLLLVVLPCREGWSGFLPGKTLEYLAAGRPILMLGPEGDVGNLVRETQAGIVVDPRDVTGAKAALYGLYLEWKQGRAHDGVDPDKIRAYEWQSLTQRLANVLSEAVRGAG